MFKNSDGHPDFLKTLLWAFSAAFLLRYLLGGIALPGLGAIPAFDPAPVLAVFGLLLPAYVARRNGLGNKDAASALSGADRAAAKDPQP